MSVPTRIIHPPNQAILSTNNIQGGGVYIDEKYPFFGRRLNTAAGHLAYNSTELSVDFDDTSRYNDADMIAIIAQFNHNKLLGSNAIPHIHWLQSSANVPNMMIRYRWYNNGATPGAWANAAYTGNMVTYSAGTIMNIMTFAALTPPSGETLSSFCDIKIYRDTANTSTLFAGADPLGGDTLMKEFDFHVQVDASGSQSEYGKF